MKFLNTIICLWITTMIYAQDPTPVPVELEVDGKARISEMDVSQTASENVVRNHDGTLEIRKYAIGDLIEGGIVFWVDNSGEHGLVCSLEELGPASWNLQMNPNSTRAYGKGLYAGQMNTMLIIANQSGNSAISAARLCMEFSASVGSVSYGDWYLPSTDELLLIHDRRNDILEITLANGGDDFANQYWSSEEVDAGTAYLINLNDGSMSTQSKANSNGVRAVRKF